MVLKPQQRIITSLYFENARCPICCGTQHIDCPGEKVIKPFTDEVETQFLPCSNGRLWGQRDTHILCDGTGQVNCPYCQKSPAADDEPLEECGKVRAYTLDIVELGGNPTKRFAFMKISRQNAVLCPRPIRYAVPCGNGSGRFMSFWTRSANEFPKEEK